MDLNSSLFFKTVMSSKKPSNIFGPARRGLFCFTFGIFTYATAAPPLDSEIAASIPMVDKSMGYVSLADRLNGLGITLKNVSVYRMTVDDLQADPIRLRKGDIEYKFFTSDPPVPVRAICPIGSNFTFIKRGKQWLPQDRTSNFLVNGFSKCVAPPV